MGNSRPFVGEDFVERAKHPLIVINHQQALIFNFSCHPIHWLA